MNASELSFGIEIETTMPMTFNVGSYGAPQQVAGLPRGWKSKTDCSIRAGRNRRGCEFVSPILHGSDGLRQVLEVVAKLNEWGAKVNQSTGLHIHVGGFLTPAAQRDVDKDIRKLLTLVANFETAIFASTGSVSREHGTYCKPVQRYESYEQATGTSQSPVGYRDNRMRDRFHVLNISNISNPNKRTVEFRAFQATLSTVKVVGYIRLCLGLVERALKAKRVTNWKAVDVKASSPIARKGDGQTALARLFYQLGWIKGRQNHVHGNITCEGAPHQKSVRVELMRLAKKYDAAKAARN